MIPRRLIRSVPETSSDSQEALWAEAVALHPDWVHDTYRDPIDAEPFPITSPLWGRCSNGAQLAGLVRLEALWWGGGVWLDSDVQVHRPLTPLLELDAFGCWEDQSIVPDAVLGASPRHPAIRACLDLAMARITGTSSEPVSWMTDRGAWSTGPGVTTTIFPYRDDVLCLPPDAFFPIHYEPRSTLGERLAAHRPAPWTFGTHRWDWSWR